jgi:SAM-dependent methyltransferase
MDQDQSMGENVNFDLMCRLGLRWSSAKKREKQLAELGFWRNELTQYLQWYSGNPLYGMPPPKESQKIVCHGAVADAATTWLILWQERKYRADLLLPADAFIGKRILDVGCGPFPNLLAFNHCERHGVDGLIEGYREIGYPLDLWSSWGFTYHSQFAERMSFPDGFFDVVISVNAIDHVDDFAQASREIKRVLAPDGVLCMHVHYHAATSCEPVELTDRVFAEHYGWVRGVRVVRRSRTKDLGCYTCPEGESYAVWSNFRNHLMEDIHTGNSMPSSSS